MYRIMYRFFVALVRLAVRSRRSKYLEIIVWVPETVLWLVSGISVLVDESVTAGRSQGLGGVCLAGLVGRWRRVVADRANGGAGGCVVIDVVDDKLVELATVPDDGAIEELASKGAHPAFGERVRHRGAYRCLEDLHSFGSEDLVEGVDELVAAVAHKRTRPSESVGMAQEQVPRRLGGPHAGASPTACRG